MDSHSSLFAFFFYYKERSKEIKTENQKRINVIYTYIDESKNVRALNNINPTKHLRILVPTPFWHVICINFLQWCRLLTFFDAILAKFGLRIKNSFYLGQIYEEY